MPSLVLNELSCSYPERYRPMSAEELSRYFSCADNRAGIHDGERHAAVSVSFAKAGWLYALTDAASVLKGAQKSMKRNLKNYRELETRSLTVAGQKASAVRFEYTANDKQIEQCGELVVFRYKKKFYSVYYITWKEFNEQNQPTFYEMLESMSLQ